VELPDLKLEKKVKSMQVSSQFPTRIHSTLTVSVGKVANQSGRGFGR
jgi:hypothetical protein